MIRSCSICVVPTGPWHSWLYFAEYGVGMGMGEGWLLVIFPWGVKSCPQDVMFEGEVEMSLGHMLAQVEGFVVIDSLGTSPTSDVWSCSTRVSILAVMATIPSSIRWTSSCSWWYRPSKGSSPGYPSCSPFLPPMAHAGILTLGPLPRPLLGYDIELEVDWQPSRKGESL